MAQYIVLLAVFLRIFFFPQTLACGSPEQHHLTRKPCPGMSWISGTPAFSQRRAAGYQGSTEGTRNTALCDTGPCGTHSNIRRQLGLVADFSPCSCQLGFLTDATTHFPHVSSQTLSSLKIRGKKKKKRVATETGLLCNAETV